VLSAHNSLVRNSRYVKYPPEVERERSPVFGDSQGAVRAAVDVLQLKCTTVLQATEQSCRILGNQLDLDGDGEHHRAPVDFGV
jgi:hypothetical protein